VGGRRADARAAARLRRRPRGGARPPYLSEAARHFLLGLDEPPELSEEERLELYLLRKHFGISAEEADKLLPAWEVRLLLEQLADEMEALAAARGGAEPEPDPAARVTGGDPWSAAPKGLENL
jgi:hypothetical protein